MINYVTFSNDLFEKFWSKSMKIFKRPHFRTYGQSMKSCVHEIREHSMNEKFTPKLGLRGHYRLSNICVECVTPQVSRLTSSDVTVMRLWWNTT